MKVFAAACLIATTFAFDISALTNADPKNILTGIPQLGSVPAFDKEDGFDSMIKDLEADRNACASEAHADCAIGIDLES